MDVNLFDIVDQKLFLEMEQNRFISHTCHPSLPLKIYNYTETTQFDRMWNPVTNICRGLIIDHNGIIIARPFAKFHNINTEWLPETMLSNLPLQEPIITKKLDGSLGIYWKYISHIGIATRGSFTSDQARWATYRINPNWQWPEGYTPVFEIIYNANRIVVDYSFEDVVLLALVNIETGEERNRESLEAYASYNKLKVVDKINGLVVEETLEQNIPNEEGYVLSWPKHDQPALKVKVKFEDYVKLHRIVTGWNPRTVWELLSTGKEDTITLLLTDNSYPDGFKLWLRNWYIDLTEQFKSIYKQVNETFRPCRKQIAEFIKIQNVNLQAPLFGLMSGDISEIIWKQLEPRGDDLKYRKMDQGEADIETTESEQ